MKGESILKAVLFKKLEAKQAGYGAFGSLSWTYVYMIDQNTHHPWFMMVMSGNHLSNYLQRSTLFGVIKSKEWNFPIESIHIHFLIPLIPQGP